MIPAAHRSSVGPRPGQVGKLPAPPAAHGSNVGPTPDCGSWRTYEVRWPDGQAQLAGRGDRDLLVQHGRYIQGHAERAPRCTHQSFLVGFLKCSAEGHPDQGVLQMRFHGHCRAPEQNLPQTLIGPTWAETQGCNSPFRTAVRKVKTLTISNRPSSCLAAQHFQLTLSCFLLGDLLP